MPGFRTLELPWLELSNIFGLDNAHYYLKQKFQHQRLEPFKYSLKKRA